MVLLSLTRPTKITGDYRKNALARAVLPDRILAKIQPAFGHWIWTGCRHPDGYGKTVLDGRYRYSHAAVYELLVGPIESGLEHDHLCRVRACVNPACIEPVTGDVNRARGVHGNQHAAKTHCPQGHEYTPENTYRYGGRAGRSCKACKRLRKAGLL